MIIERATEKDFEQIIGLIHDFELDNRSLVYKDFLVAKAENSIAGFARIRMYHDCSELCSLGVLEAYRHKNVGSLLVKQLVLNSTLPLFLVTIIPEFFKKLGFVLVNDYPNEIQDKLNYCTSSLVVPEKYLVMRLLA